MSKIRHQWTEDEIIAVAANYKHKGDWKRSSDRLHSAAYQATFRRPGLLVRASAHMTPKSSPYSGSYIIYAFEFTDSHAYIGLTFTPAARFAQHMARGPVFEHIKICSAYTYKILRSGLNSPQEAIEHERHWIKWYQKDWILLNAAPGGGLGTVQLTKWTRESVIAEARKYASKQEWIDSSQFTYRLAKREGWFDEASAHMPRRVLGIGVGRKVSQATRRKQRQAKLGTVHTKQHRKNQSKAIKAWWVRQNATPLGPP